jgi:hypothetical protein
MKKSYPIIQSILILISILSINCSTFGLVSSNERKLFREAESKNFQAKRSYLKAKQWFTYRLEGKNAKVNLDLPEQGKIEGTGFFQCRVPYGVEEVDVQFHEFQYKFQLVESKANILIEDIYSYSKDPNEITISYGPRTKKEAVTTIRLCFDPLVEDLFAFIQ